jgi:hypothetical protein
MGIAFRVHRRELAFARVAVAWKRYLTAVRACSSELYEQTEELAWRRLVGELARLGRPLVSG